MSREKVREIKDDETLEKEKKMNEHTRSERLNTVVNWSIVCLIIGLFFVLFLLFSALAVHWYQTENWDAVYKLLSAATGFASGYIISYLKSNGVRF